MHQSRSKAGRLPAVLAALVALLLAADLAVRIVPASRATRRSHAVLAAFTAPAPGIAQPESLTTASRAGATDSATTGGRLGRGAVLRRLSEDGPGTYLPAMLVQVDSAIRRWPDDRFRRPLQIAIRRTGPIGYREEFAGTIAFAVNQWNGAQLPVLLDLRGSDTAGADITVEWVTRLDSGRTGKADVTWDQRQYIRRVAVALATHTPDGRELTVSEMTALALHELGHAIGLAHSPDPADALFPMTRAASLSARDRATARLLYALPPGSLRR